MFASSMREWSGQDGAGRGLWELLGSDLVRYDTARLAAAGVDTEEEFQRLLSFEASLSTWSARKRGAPEPGAWYSLTDHGPVFDESLSDGEKERAYQTLQEEFNRLARVNPEGARAFAAYIKARGE